MRFKDKDDVALSLQAGYILEFIEPGLFKTEEYLLPLTDESFQNSLPYSVGSVPPIIQNVKEAKTIIESAEQSTDAFLILSSSSFLIMSLMTLAMEKLWGSIRTIKIIYLSCLTKFMMPVNLSLFLQICVTFADMDIFNGQNLTEDTFTFIETTALNDQFDFFGVGSKILMLNIGSYFILQIIIFG